MSYWARKEDLLRAWAKFVESGSSLSFAEWNALGRPADAAAVLGPSPFPLSVGTYHLRRWHEPLVRPPQAPVQEPATAPLEPPTPLVGHRAIVRAGEAEV